MSFPKKKKKRRVPVFVAKEESATVAQRDASLETTSFLHCSLKTVHKKKKKK
jgi:hypothetical protein